MSPGSRFSVKLKWLEVVFAAKDKQALKHIGVWCHVSANVQTKFLQTHRYLV